ncbi:MAG TPA: DinB family protein [Gammaproteobacteria bacterium]|nr:DinB family protein [Gammaproteobacteria bacterium]
MSISKLILSELEQTPREFEKFLAAAPVSVWDWKPDDWGGCPGETFTLREHLCHVRDFDTLGYQDRFRRTREEEAPVLPSLDGYAMARERGYAKTDPREALAAFAAARVETLAVIRGFASAELRRPADFAEYGRVTLGGLVHYLSAHDRQHLACLHWLLGKQADAA